MVTVVQSAPVGYSFAPPPAVEFPSAPTPGNILIGVYFTTAEIPGFPIDPFWTLIAQGTAGKQGWQWFAHIVVPGDVALCPAFYDYADDAHNQGCAWETSLTDTFAGNLQMQDFYSDAADPPSPCVVPTGGGVAPQSPTLCLVFGVGNSPNSEPSAGALLPPYAQDEASGGAFFCYVAGNAVFAATAEVTATVDYTAQDVAGQSGATLLVLYNVAAAKFVPVIAPVLATQLPCVPCQQMCIGLPI